MAVKNEAHDRAENLQRDPAVDACSLNILPMAGAATGSLFHYTTRLLLLAGGEVMHLKTL